MKKLTPFNLLIAIGVVLFLGRTLDLIDDPTNPHFGPILDFFAVLLAILFGLFVYQAFKHRKK